MKGIEILLYELSGGDPLKAHEMRKLPVNLLYNFSYMNRLKQLNPVLLQIERIERGNRE
jgi:hypothetical protein